MFQVLTDPDEFVRFVGHPSPQRTPPPSRLPPPRLQEALDCGIIVPASRSKPPHFFHSAFTVPKANGTTSRLVVNPPTLNDHTTPWPCLLPSILELITEVLTWSYVTMEDAVSCFYQFGLSPQVQRFFGVRQKGFKGQLTAMGQGWSPAPSISQLTGKAHMHGLPARCWIDNYLLGGHSLEEAQEVAVEFRRRCQQTNLQLKGESSAPVQHLTALGLDFDLTTHMYRLDPDWADAQAIFVSDFLTETRHGWRPPLRMLWKCIGVLLWFCMVSQRSLGKYCYNIIACMRHLGMDPHWDQPCSVPTTALDDIQSLLISLQLNAFMVSPAQSSFSIEEFQTWLATDACHTGGAYITYICRPSSAHASWWHWRGRASSSKSMPCLEALAFLRALQDTSPQTPSPILWIVDCLPTKLAFDRRYSPRAKLNGILQQIFTILEERGWKARPVWVPTHLQPADWWSRRLDAPGFETLSNPFPPSSLLDFVYNEFASGG